MGTTNDPAIDTDTPTTDMTAGTQWRDLVDFGEHLVKGKADKKNPLDAITALTIVKHWDAIKEVMEPSDGAFSPKVTTPPNMDTETQDLILTVDSRAFAALGAAYLLLQQLSTDQPHVGRRVPPAMIEPVLQMMRQAGLGV